MLNYKLYCNFFPIEKVSSFLHTKYNSHFKKLWRSSSSPEPSTTSHNEQIDFLTDNGVKSLGWIEQGLGFSSALTRTRRGDMTNQEHVQPHLLSKDCKLPTSTRLKYLDGFLLTYMPQMRNKRKTKSPFNSNKQHHLWLFFVQSVPISISSSHFVLSKLLQQINQLIFSPARTQAHATEVWVGTKESGTTRMRMLT